MYVLLYRGYGSVVEHVLAKDEMGVRFPLAAHKIPFYTFPYVFILGYRWNV